MGEADRLPKCAVCIGATVGSGEKGEEGPKLLAFIPGPGGGRARQIVVGNARNVHFCTLHPAAQKNSWSGNHMRPDPSESLFHFVMIKPSHYDDDGYPIQWVRSAIPSNTLACLNGLAEDAPAQGARPGCRIPSPTYERRTARAPDRIIRMIRKEAAAR